MWSRRATELPLAELAEIINAAFTGYIGTPVVLTAESLADFCPRNNVSLELSYVFYESETSTEPLAFAFIGVREDKPGEARLVSMGVVPSSQGKGAGSRALQRVIDAERQRGTKILELECIVQNERGVRLYHRAGFKTIGEMVGWETTEALSDPPKPNADLTRCSIEEVDDKVRAYGSKTLPWQAAGFAKLERSVNAFRLGDAYCVVSDMDDDTKDMVYLTCLIVEPQSRRKGEAKRLVQAVMALCPGKKFRAMPIFPLEYGEPLATSLGLTKMDKWLYQMRLDLA